jgi:MFS family permease
VDSMPTDAITADSLAVTTGISVPPQVAQPTPRLRQLSSLLNASKAEIRTSLKASTLDGMFATVFSTVTGGVLLTNFLLGLSANPTEIAMVASIPMLANLVQPIGAYLSEQTTSRHFYCLWIYGIARSLWLALAIAILLGNLAPAALITLTLAVVTLSYFLGAFGSAPWLSWIAILVPRQLRGRYFGLRTSAANLTSLIAVPLTGLIVSKWQGGSIQGYGVVLILGVIFGLISLWFQNFMVDINPQTGQRFVKREIHPEVDSSVGQQLFEPISWQQLWSDRNFLKFLLYFNFWTFAVNLSAPFFNVYMLDTLHLNINYVTFYNSLLAGANLLMLMVWGKLADRIGNRPILLGVGIIFALFPSLWLMTGTTSLSTWLLLPLLHMIAGGTAAAIDLSTNNLQLSIAPKHNPSIYFGTAAAFAGISGALGATAGGFLIQFSGYTGLLGLFALSSLLRLIAMLPLIFVTERPSSEVSNLRYQAPLP